MTYRDITLTAATINYGRLYFSSQDVKFFPADAFGDRTGAGHQGVPVILKAGSYQFETDIRISSGQRLSPRRSLRKFLAEVAAAPGDTLRVTRVADRCYELTLAPRPAA